MKKIGILLLILVVLVGGYLLLRYFTRPPEFVPPSEFSLSQWDDEHVNELRFVYESGKQMVLKEHDGAWFLGEQYADTNQIAALFEAFSQAQLTSRVSINSQNHERFNVNAKGTRLSLVSNDAVIQEVIFGKSAGGNNIYVRLPDQDSVYVLSNVPQYFFIENEDSWADKRLVREAATDVRKVDYKEGAVNWIISKLSSTWQVSSLQFNDVAVDETKTTQFIGQITGQSAQGFTKAEERAVIEEGKSPVALAEIELGTPQEFRNRVNLKFYRGSEAGQLIVFRNEERIGFVITQDQFDQFSLDYGTLLKQLTADAQTK